MHIPEESRCASQTLVDPSFWHKFGDLKLDTLRLSERAQALTGAC